MGQGSRGVRPLPCHHLPPCGPQPASAVLLCMVIEFPETWACFTCFFVTSVSEPSLLGLPCAEGVEGSPRGGRALE
jgi:hypothetical protein